MKNQWISQVFLRAAFLLLDEANRGLLSLDSDLAINQIRVHIQVHLDFDFVSLAFGLNFKEKEGRIWITIDVTAQPTTRFT